MGLQVDLLKSEYPHNTEFIDFSFDGKKITDFGLVAVVDGDRLQFDGSPSFTDETTTINGVVGQYYWGTNIGTKTKTYTLATDGMTEQQVQAFQYHFRPGRYGKFIDDTFAYRYSYCRISSVTNFKMIPFKKEIEYTINKRKIKSFVNEYKGEVTISFTWDYPYSFSETNYIDNEDLLSGKENVDPIPYWRAVVNNQLPIPESWKVYIPSTAGILGHGVLGKLILGEGSPTQYCYLGADQKISSGGFSSDNGFTVPQGSSSVKNRMLFYNPSTIETPCEISIEGLQLHFTPIEWDANTPWKTVYFNDIADIYNVKSAVAVERGEKHVDTETGNVSYSNKYVSLSKPYNSISTTDKLNPPQIKDHEKGASDDDYQSFITLLEKEEGAGAQKHFFYYTTPNIISQIHLAIKIAERYHLLEEPEKPEGRRTNILELEEELRETLVNDEILAWAMGVLEYLKCTEVCGASDRIQFDVKKKHALDFTRVREYCIDDSSNKGPYRENVDWFGYFNMLMLHFFMGIPNGLGATVNGLTTLSLAKGVADQENGWVGRYRIDNNGNKIYSQLRSISLTFDGSNNRTTVRYSGNYIKSQTSIKVSDIVEKQCGDAILSSYLKLGGGNSLTPDGQIASCYCLSFRHGGNYSSVPTTKIRYKYTYV